MSPVTKASAVSKKEAQLAKRFRRSNTTVGLRIANGVSWSLLSRKLLSVMLYHTQRLRVPGKDNPTGEAKFEKFYWLPLSEFIGDANFNSNNIDYLDETLKSLQDIRLHCDDGGGVGGAVILSDYRIFSNGMGRGVERYVGWALPPTVEALAMDPDVYTVMNLFFLTSLRSSAALGLYEVAIRYVSNPGGLTMKRPVSYWNELLRGVSVGTEVGPYKNFKRDCLKPAIKEINSELTDIFIELIEHTNKRTVEELQFRVTKKAQIHLFSQSSPVIDNALIDSLIQIGFSKREACDMSASNNTDLVRTTAEFVLSRLSDQKLGPVDNPCGFFMSALKNGYGTKKPRATKKKEPSIDTPAKPVEMSEEALAEGLRRSQALERLNQMSEEEYAALVLKVCDADKAQASIIKRNPKGKVAKALCVTWLISRD